MEALNYVELLSRWCNAASRISEEKSKARTSRWRPLCPHPTPQRPSRHLLALQIPLVSSSPLQLSSQSLFSSPRISVLFHAPSYYFFHSFMGISCAAASQAPEMMTRSHYNTHKAFLMCNYLLLGAASSCVFLTLSLRLVPSACGLLLILLHALTIAAAVCGCSAASSHTSSARWHGAHMVSTVLAAIFQGAVAVLVFTRTSDFLGELKSYVREDDGAVILRMVGGLCVAIFCLEWVVLALAFALRYYAYVEGDCSGSGSGTRRSAKVQSEEEMKDWPWPFQV